MKQWLILSGVTIVFLLVWSTVVYQIFIKEEPTVNYAQDLSLAIRGKLNVEIRPSSISIDKADDQIVLITKKFTEKNNNSTPKIDKGLDFGAGISVDDLLESYGLTNKNN